MNNKERLESNSWGSFLVSELVDGKGNLEIDKLPLNFQELNKREEAVLGIVFSGGGALSSMHIGALIALLEIGVNPDFTVGTSAGSIAAIVMSRAYSLEAVLRAKRYGEAVNWEDLMVRVPYFRGGPGAVSFIPLVEYINDNTEGIDEIFSNGRDHLPYAVVATEKRGSGVESRVFLNLPIPELGYAVGASCAVPGLVTPIKINGRTFIDGGLGSAHEPVAIAQTLVPGAAIISVRLGKEAGVEVYEAENLVRFNVRRNEPSLLDPKNFHQDDVYRGYRIVSENIGPVIEFLKLRGIDLAFIDGFSAEKNLNWYFEQSRWSG